MAIQNVDAILSRSADDVLPHGSQVHVERHSVLRGPPDDVVAHRHHGPIARVDGYPTRRIRDAVAGDDHATVFDANADPTRGTGERSHHVVENGYQHAILAGCPDPAGGVASDDTRPVTTDSIHNVRMLD